MEFRYIYKKNENSFRCGGLRVSASDGARIGGGGGEAVGRPREAQGALLLSAPVAGPSVDSLLRLPKITVYSWPFDCRSVCAPSCYGSSAGAGCSGAGAGCVDANFFCGVAPAPCCPFAPPHAGQQRRAHQPRWPCAAACTGPSSAPDASRPDCAPPLGRAPAAEPPAVDAFAPCASAASGFRRVSCSACALRLAQAECGPGPCWRDAAAPPCPAPAAAPNPPPCRTPRRPPRAPPTPSRPPSPPPSPSPPSFRPPSSRTRPPTPRPARPAPEAPPRKRRPPLHPNSTTALPAPRTASAVIRSVQWPSIYRRGSSSKLPAFLVPECRPRKCVSCPQVRRCAPGAVCRQMPHARCRFLPCVRCASQPNTCCRGRLTSNKRSAMCGQFF